MREDSLYTKWVLRRALDWRQGWSRMTEQQTGGDQKVVDLCRGGMSTAPDRSGWMKRGHRVCGRARSRGAELWLVVLIGRSGVGGRSGSGQQEEACLLQRAQRLEWSSGMALRRRRLSVRGLACLG